MKTSKKRLYASPEILRIHIAPEAGFAVSYDPYENTEEIGSYEEETL